VEFKQQLGDLHKLKKRKSNLIRGYEVGATALNRWIRQSENSGSFKYKNNLSSEQHEWIELRKRKRQLEMEVDILKQAALIMARKDRESVPTKINTLSQRAVRFFNFLNPAFITKQKLKGMKVCLNSESRAFLEKIESLMVLEESKRH
jgi:transposase